MANHRKDLFWGNASVKRNGVPVFLVHVIAGFHGEILFSQFDGAFRFAFEIDRDRMSVHADKDEDFSIDLKHKHVLVEREFLGDLAFLLQAVSSERV